MNEVEENAFSLINQVCGDFKGSLKDHQNIQHALQVIKEKMTDKKEKENEED